jgi:hypothetical protein
VTKADIPEVRRSIPAKIRSKLESSLTPFAKKNPARISIKMEKKNII